MAMAMSEYTHNIKFADPVIQTGVPKMLSSVSALELYAMGKHSINRINPVRSWTRDIPTIPMVVRKVVASGIEDAHVIVGTCSEI